MHCLVNGESTGPAENDRRTRRETDARRRLESRLHAHRRWCL